MQEFTQDSTRNKLVLLFILDKMEIPLLENTIVDVCQKNNWIDLFYCKTALEQLLESNFVCKLKSAGNSEPYYNITAEGRVCLAHFFIKIPSSLRENISTYIRANRMSFRRTQEYVSTYEKQGDGSYVVRLKIIENLTPVYEVNLVVPNRNIAKYIDKNWGAKAPKAYQQFYDFISE